MSLIFFLFCSFFWIWLSFGYKYFYILVQMPGSPTVLPPPPPELPLAASFIIMCYLFLSYINFLHYSFPSHLCFRPLLFSLPMRSSFSPFGFLTCPNFPYAGSISSFFLSLRSLLLPKTKPSNQVSLSLPLLTFLRSLFFGFPGSLYEVMTPAL